MSVYGVASRAETSMLKLFSLVQGIANLQELENQVLIKSCFVNYL